MRLTASKFAKLADTMARTLRHYRQLGILVPPHKNEKNHYIYVNADFKRLHEIQLLLPKHTMEFLKEAFEVLNSKNNSSLQD
ncbi:MerR family transcriptional regulator [Paenibacillus sp. OK003]|uniref:MerR family transcriptional regulator n=1 Tax=Paenibacillus sp. OK003 TaxID=1884380 RepID=UPI0008D6ADF7|nr:MerR family transcriptional regulator [Paenibacillus sp. OK003]SEK59659.1 MerR HTH family regulatory protein [Paenibacillus sp. OK003]